MTCPSCASNVEKVGGYTTVSCTACGYALEGPQTNYVAVLASLDRSVRTIKGIVVAWFWVGVVIFGLLIAKAITH
ncbi:MAG: hypothetical protein ABSH56_10675 [Bryobacteraceae bacterium]